MEISKKSNFRFKALVIGLITVILTSTCATTVFGAFEVFSIFGKDEKEAYLNRKVTFTGATHWRSDGQGRKLSLFKKGEDIRKPYGDDEVNCGIITLMDFREGIPYKFYVTGEGWIGEGQIQEASRYVSLQFEKIETTNGFGLNGKLHVDGEYLEITSDNDAVVRFDKDSNSLIAEGAGSTVVKFHPGEGKEDIEVVAVVVGDDNKENGLQLALNIDEMNLTAELKEATIEVYNDTVSVDASGKAVAGIKVSEDGKIGVYAQGEGEATLKYKDQEIATIDAKGDITATFDPKEVSLDVTANAEQNLTILQRLTIGLREQANAIIDTQHVEASVDGGVTNGEHEIIGGNARINYNYNETDPTGDATLRISEKPITLMEDKPIPIVSGLKALIGMIR